MEVQRFERETKVAWQIEVRTTKLRDELDKYKAKLGFRRPFLKIDTWGGKAICRASKRTFDQSMRVLVARR